MKRPSPKQVSGKAFETREVVSFAEDLETSQYIPSVMLLVSNVIKLMYSSYYYLLYVYLPVCMKYEYLQFTLLPLHIYTWGMLKAWPTHVRLFDLIGQLSG